MDSNLLSMLGLARRAGHLEAGEEPVDAITRAKDARLLLLASDAADNTRRRVEHFAQNGACLWLRVPFTKDELGHAVGRTSCAIVALTDIGFASAVARRLADTDPAQYGQAAERLEVKARRASERRAELLAHEKNVRTGKVRAHPAKGGGEAAAPAPVPPREAERKRPAAGGPAPRRPARDGKPGGYAKPGFFGKARPSGKPGFTGKTGNAGKPAFSGRPAAAGKPDTPGSGAAGKPGFPGKGGFKAKGGHRPFKSERRPARPASPYSHSRPVKRGKGSFRKREDG